jgi:hypothetical protein
MHVSERNAYIWTHHGGRCGRDCIVTIKVVNSNPTQVVYSIQHYVIKFVSDLRQAGWFSPGTPVSSANKIDHHNITEILLKVVLNTINLTLGYPNRLVLFY